MGSQASGRPRMTMKPAPGSEKAGARCANCSRGGRWWASLCPVFLLGLHLQRACFLLVIDGSRFLHILANSMPGSQRWGCREVVRSRVGAFYFSICSCWRRGCGFFFVVSTPLPGSDLTRRNKRGPPAVPPSPTYLGAPSPRVRLWRSFRWFGQPGSRVQCSHFFGGRGVAALGAGGMEEPAKELAQRARYLPGSGSWCINIFFRHMLASAGFCQLLQGMPTKSSKPHRSSRR